MKKYLLTILCVLTAVCTMAQTERIYTEQVVILSEDGEPSEPQEAQISVVENGDGTINFVLKNFIINAEGNTIAVGNIVINNLPVTEGEDGLDHVSYDGSITITAGDLEDVLVWMGPLFGEIPVVLDGKMNEEKLYVSLDINVGGSIIPVLIGTDDFFATRIYTEPIVILSDDGVSSEPQEAQISVTENGDGTINFVLKNFMMSVDETVVGVGNIVINNLSVIEGDDGLDHVFFKGVIFITEGDLEDVVFWLGPMFGDVPIELNAKMNEEKLFATIVIEMGESVVTVQVGTDFGPVTIVKGDLNGDTVVDIGDAVSILNLMSEGFYNMAADINGDDKVDIADFVGILNIMAEQ